MKKPVWIFAAFGLLVPLFAGFVFYSVTRIQAGNESSPSPPSISPAPGEHLRGDWTRQEVFRRAFWRHPGADDRIERAVRFESSGDQGVSRWVWFMKIHPSAELLRDLRDPATFGLMSVDRPRGDLPKDLSAPDWYPALTGETGAEILQHPSQPLTLIYKSAENLLYASDYGNGFAKAQPE